jgi:hypothetical protein
VAPCSQLTARGDWVADAAVSLPATGDGEVESNAENLFHDGTQPFVGCGEIPLATCVNLLPQFPFAVFATKTRATGKKWLTILRTILLAAQLSS